MTSHPSSPAPVIAPEGLKSLASVSPWTVSAPEKSFYDPVRVAAAPNENVVQPKNTLTPPGSMGFLRPGKR
jgi:hypothetical protein